MEWTQSLSVGVQEIDDQHKELINRLNALFDSMEAKKAMGEVISVLGFLEKYVVTHFSDEEKLQARVQYPNAAEHRKMHQEFIGEIKKVKAGLEKDGFTVMTKTLVASLLVNWLVTHISKQDKDIGDYIRANCR